MVHVTRGTFLERHSPWLTVALATASMAWWTWGTWPDPLIDFGRELYLAWRVAAGQRLYVDVASFNGPLSPHVNALWFTLFGVGLRSLVIGNFIVLAVFLPVLFRVLEEVSDRFTSALAVLVFVVLFAFGEYDDVGNFNYITPYSHELVHGIVLSFGGLLGMCHYARTERRAFLALAGACLGLVFLTKPEVFLAAVVAIGGGGLLLVSLNERAGAERWRAGSVLVASALAPVLIATLALAARSSSSVSASLTTLIGPYRHLVNPALAALPFYERVTGLDAPGASAGAIALWTLIYVAIFGGAAALAFPVKRRGLGVEAGGVCGLAIFALGITQYGAVVTGVARPFVVFLSGAGVVFAASLRVRWAAGDDARRTVSRLALTVFAGLLLLKVVFNTHLYRYGFALAMPASMVVIVALASWIPDRLAQRGGDGRFFRTVACSGLATVCLIFLMAHAERIRKLTYVVGTGPDRFLADSRAIPVNAALAEIGLRLASSDRLVVLPEGVMLNFLARRVSAVPYPTFLPPEFVMFGADPILDAMKTHPPEYIALLDRPMTEYGLEGFGIDYGLALMRWVTEHYAPVATSPGAPIAGHSFGIELLRRQESGTDDAAP